jgi:hypothetical protein
MRKFLTAILLVTAISASGAAQSGAVSAGYTYLRTPTGNGDHANLNGWYFIPSVNLNKWFGVFADFTNFYGTSRGSNLTVHGFTFGPMVSWTNRTRITPVAFTEAGLVRSDLAGNVTDAFGWVVGGGLEVKMNSHMNLQVIPAEYILTRANGTNNNNYTMKIGLTFPLKK